MEKQFCCVCGADISKSALSIDMKKWMCGKCHAEAFTKSVDENVRLISDTPRSKDTGGASEGATK